MKRTLIFSLICLAALSCKKDQSPTNEGNPTGLLSKILISGEPNQEFTYTSSGLIYEEKSWAMYFKHTYNSDDLLVKSESYVDPSIVSSSSYVIEEAQKKKRMGQFRKCPEECYQHLFIP